VSRDRALAYTAFAIVCTVWGTTYLAIRVAVETIPPLLLTAARFITAGVALFIVAWLRGDRPPRDRRTLVNIAVIGILMFSIGNFSVIWAEQWVPSGLAALFVATAPFWVTIIEVMHGSAEPIGRRRLAGMLIGFVGVALLVTPRGAGGAFDVHLLLGALAIQAGCVGWQGGTVYAKHALGKVPPLMSSSLQMFSGGVVVLVAGLAGGELPRFHLTPRTFTALAYLTLFGSVLTYTAYVYALKSLRTTTMSLYAYINPVVAVILGWLILHERLTWVSVVAMSIILGGVAMVQSARTVYSANASRTVDRRRAA
jgi:drug/metabolite transporter (DMT)-like permease